MKNNPEDLKNISPRDIPGKFPEIQQMLALSDLMRDYEKRAIDSPALWSGLTELLGDNERSRNIYSKLTGNNVNE